MKCPNCDFDNAYGSKSCSWCKKPLPPEAAPPPLQAQPRPPVPAAKKPSGARRTVKPADPRQLKYVALVGVLVAMIFNEVYARAHSGAVETFFGRGTFTAVRILSDLMVAVFAYYNSYKLAEQPSFGNAFGRGALSGFFTGLVAGTCAGSLSGAAFAALIGLPVGAFFGFVNLLLVHSLTKEEEKPLVGGSAPAGGESDESSPYYLNLYALVGGLFAVIANFVFLLPHARQMHGQYGNVLATTSALCGGVGLYFGKKIARTRSRGRAAHLGALGGFWIGVVNGTVVFPIIGTIIGGVLGAIIGGIFGGPLAFYLINVAKWLLLDDGNPQGASARTEPNNCGEADRQRGESEAKCLGSKLENVRAAAVCVECKEQPMREAAPQPGSCRRLKPPEGAQLRFLALIGVLMAVACNDSYVRSHGGSVVFFFGPNNYFAVRLLTDLIAAVIGYYGSYKLAAKPRPSNALLCGALSGLLVGMVAGACAGLGANTVDAAMLGLAAGAVLGIINLGVVYPFMRKETPAAVAVPAPAGQSAAEQPQFPSDGPDAEEENPSAVREAAHEVLDAPERAQPPGVGSYSVFCAMIGLVANMLFLIPWARQMGDRFMGILMLTSLLVAGIGLYFGRKVALARSYGTAMGAGAAAGALIGIVNGTAVIPGGGSIIGGILGAFLGFFAGPLAYSAIKASRDAHRGG